MLSQTPTPEDVRKEYLHAEVLAAFISLGVPLGGAAARWDDYDLDFL